MNWIDFSNKAKIILRRFDRTYDIKYTETEISYTINGSEYKYSKNDYEKFYENVKTYTFENSQIYTNDRYEVIVSSLSPRGSFLLRNEMSEIKIEDPIEKIDYSIEGISEEMIFNIIKDWDETKYRLGILVNVKIMIERLEAEKLITLFDLFKIIFKNLFSLVINFKDNILDKEKIKKYVDSLLFNISYNYDISLKIITDLDEIFLDRIFKRYKFRYTMSTIQLEPPRLTYISELTEQYHMAISSEDPFIQFIGFYHIMEYFFEEIYKENIIEQVKEIILNPGFSSKRKKDIVKIIDFINKKMVSENNSLAGSERKALELTLEKYVKIEDIIEKLKDYKDNLEEYYKTTKVTFSDGDVFDLNNDKEIFKKMSSRIYKTRNSLVHSKSNEIRLKERGIYKPFKDSKELLKEIPLMRCISEEIIIKSSKEL